MKASNPRTDTLANSKRTHSSKLGKYSGNKLKTVSAPISQNDFEIAGAEAFAAWKRHNVRKALKYNEQFPNIWKTLRASTRRCRCFCYIVAPACHEICQTTGANLQATREDAQAKLTDIRASAFWNILEIAGVGNLAA